MYDYRFDEADVIHRLGLEQTSQDMQNGVIDGVYNQLYQRMNVKLDALMTDDDVKHFSEVSDEEANKWLKERFPNYKELFDEELDALIDEMNGYADTAAAGGKE